MRLPDKTSLNFPYGASWRRTRVARPHGSQAAREPDPAREGEQHELLGPAGTAVVSPGRADPDQGLFSISVAAELSGLHPQTLRIYEREGLLTPVRSPGGTRRYSSRDLGRLREICALTADGLNLAGIRRVLELQEETRRLQAEVAALRERAEGRPPGGGTRSSRPAPGHAAAG
ncbi:MAG: helix-turn-helix transcriptional regulator [Nocardiopsaceae bacterium]|nr:helix-turn-helix transcriptional regulator [Nocardiopsaceae bacterium]